MTGLRNGDVHVYIVPFAREGQPAALHPFSQDGSMTDKSCSDGESDSFGDGVHPVVTQ